MEKYLLYIDILGFSNLVNAGSNKVDEIYNVIASLNAHDHPNFKTIIFSDTILIYNWTEPVREYDHYYIVRFMCEFVQDLQNRLVGKGVFFRAILTKGDFNHYTIRGTQCFYGKALIYAYNSEKEIQAIGLFIDKNCRPFCDIFEQRYYNPRFNYVLLIRSINRLEDWFRAEFPIIPEFIEQESLSWFIVPEIITLNYLYRNSVEFPDDKIALKYKNTIEIYLRRYPKLLPILIQNNFDPTFISPSINWQEVFDRYPEDYSFVRNRYK